MTKPAKDFYEFGPFSLDAVSRLLLREGEPVPLMPKVFETLLVLVENSGQVLGKEELMKALWPDSFVEEANLTVNISALRKALGESPNEHRYIVTVPGRGYKFVAGVREAGDESADLLLEEHTRSRIVIEDEKERREQEKKDRVEVQTALPLSTAARSRRLMRGLTSLAVTLLVVGVVVTIIYLWRSSKPKATSDGAAIRSIAVLPFKPLVADNRNESLEMGIADTLIFKLSSIREIVVRPISAVRKYADLNQDPLAAGREQQVEAVLDASIQVAGEKIRVTARLVRVEDGSVLWTDLCDQQCTNIFAVQDAIAEKLAGSLALRLTDEEKQRLTKRYTEDPEAYQLYQWGRFYFDRRAPGGHNFKKGIEYFQQAIEKEPAYALAYVGLADCYASLGSWQIVPPNESFPKARAAAERALQIDDSLAEAHTSLGLVKALYGDWSGAEAEYKRAIELNPNYEMAHHWYAIYLFGQGQRDEAMAEMRRAQELDPRSLFISAQVGRIFYLSRQYDEAIAQYQKTLEMDPYFAQAHLQLGWAYAEKMMYEEAITAYRKAIDLGGRPTFVAEIGRVYALSGKRREALKVLDELKEMSKKSYVPPADFARIYEGLGEKEQAIDWLEKAYEDGAGPMGLKVNPAWDRLRSHPRFQALLRRMGLQP